MALPADTVERLEAQLGAAEGEPTVLGGGITNHNFRARFGGREVVVRLPGNDTELLGSDRSGERRANSLAAAWSESSRPVRCVSSDLLGRK